MFFTSAAATAGTSNIAVSNAAVDEYYQPLIQTLTAATPTLRSNVKPLAYVPPTPVLSGSGGALTISGGFRTHTYTSDGASTWTLSQTTPFDPYA